MPSIKITIPDVNGLKDERSNKVKRYVRLTMAVTAAKAEARLLESARALAMDRLTGGELARANALLRDRVNAEGKL